jgi:O-antigen/teichoic acid export membrane protein
VITKYLPKGSFARNVVTLMTGTTLAQALPVAISPILTRLYTPSEFGVFAIYLACVSILAILATGRYELAIMVPKKDKDAAALVVLAFIIGLIISACIFCVVYFFNERVAGLLSFGGHSELLYWVPVSVMLTAGYQSLNYWCNRKGYYRQMSSARVAQGVSMSGVHIAAGYAKQGLFGLVAGAVTGHVVVFFSMLFTTIKKDRGNFDNLSKAYVYSVARRYVDFPKYLVVAHSLNVASFQLPVMLLGSIFGSGIAGFFMLTQRVIGAPMSIVAGAIGDVFRQEASQAYAATGRCNDIYIKTFRRLFFIAVLPFAVFFVVAPDFFSLVFGREWEVSGHYSRILMPMFFMQFITSPLSSMYMIAQRQRIDLAWQFSLFSLTLISFFFGYIFYDSRLGLCLFSASYTTMYAINGLISYRLSFGLRGRDV